MHQKLTPLVSSNLDGYAYDPVALKLIIAFKSGRHYLYDDVPQVEIDGMLDAASKGSYFSKNIRNAYNFTDMDDSDLGQAFRKWSFGAKKKPTPKRKRARSILPKLEKKYPFMRIVF